MRPALKKAGISWIGYYSLRRGIATMLNSVEKDPMAGQGASSTLEFGHNAEALH